MKKYIINDKEIDLEGVEDLLEEINRIDSCNTNVPNSRSDILKRNNPHLKYLFAAGALIFCNPGEVISNNIVFDDTESQDLFIKGYSNDVENPCNTYISQLSEFVFKNKISKMEIIKKIVSFESLRQSWDGYDAIPVEVNSAANSINLINLLEENVVESIDDIYPNTHGTVSIEWSNTSNEKLSLEVGNETFSYYIKLNSQSPQFFNDIEITAKEINKLSKQIISL